MSTTVKASILSIIQNNESIPAKIKSYMVDTVTRSKLTRSSISMNGRVVVIALDGTDAIHICNHNKAVFFQGVVRAELLVNKTLYKDILAYYNTLHTAKAKTA